MESLGLNTIHVFRVQLKPLPGFSFRAEGLMPVIFDTVWFRVVSRRHDCGFFRVAGLNLSQSSFGFCRDTDFTKPFGFYHVDESILRLFRCGGFEFLRRMEVGQDCWLMESKEFSVELHHRNSFPEDIYQQAPLRDSEPIGAFVRRH